MRPPLKRLVFWSAVGVVVIAGFSVAFRPRPVPVDMEPVAAAPMSVTVEEEGKTRIRDVYVLSAPVGGRILRIEIDVGDTVVAGKTVVARIRPQAPTFLVD